MVTCGQGLNRVEVGCKIDLAVFNAKFFSDIPPVRFHGFNGNIKTVGDVFAGKT